MFDFVDILCITVFKCTNGFCIFLLLHEKPLKRKRSERCCCVSRPSRSVL